MVRIIFLIFFGFLSHGAVADVTLNIGYLRVDVPRPPTLSNLDPLPENNGLAGAQTGLQDNQTTGKFLGQSYTMASTIVPHNGDVLRTAKEMLVVSPYLVIDAPSNLLLAIADLPEAANALLFNTSSGNMALRDTECRKNMLHSLPSDVMRTDALAQVFIQKRWRDLVMITGTYPADTAYAAAMPQIIAQVWAQTVK